MGFERGQATAEELAFRRLVVQAVRDRSMKRGQPLRNGLDLDPVAEFLSRLIRGVVAERSIDVGHRVEDRSARQLRAGPQTGPH